VAPSNRFLLVLSVLLVALSALYLVATPALARFDVRSGAPVGQSLGIAAGTMMLVSALYLPLRRAASVERGKPAYQLWHSALGLVGVALAIAHSRLSLWTPPALALLAAIGLMGTGLYGRVVSPRRLGESFGRGAVPYRSAGARGAPSPLADLIEQKQRLLARLAPGAAEARFVLRTGHWLRRPALAWRYARLAARERRLVEASPYAATGEVGPLERAWRILHLGLATLFLLGIAAHVVTTLLFAGYVAGGGPIYWWHLRR